MRKTTIFMLLCGIVLWQMLLAQIGPDVSVYQGEDLKWEGGPHDFFVMWKSLVQRTDGSVDTSASNPQADSCIDPEVGSTYTLTEGMMPADATVERAFLIWMAAIDPALLDVPTDNSVTLSFQHSSVSALSLASNITASYAGTSSITSTRDFEFEGIQYMGPNNDMQGVFTYRVDVTDFFTHIHDNGADLDIAEPGATLLGDYTVTGVTCSAAQVYKDASGLMAGWALLLVYSSNSVKSKNIYIYNGLGVYRFVSYDLEVSGFKLPVDAEIKMTLFVGEGDPGLYSAIDSNVEGLLLHGAIDASEPWISLRDSCNPNLGNYTEVYNSISSFWTFGAQSETCIGDVNTKEMEYAMDVDTFVVSANEEPFSTHLRKDDTFFFLKIGANQDQVYPNLLVLSVDTASDEEPVQDDETVDGPDTDETSDQSPDGTVDGGDDGTTDADMAADQTVHADADRATGDIEPVEDGDSVKHTTGGGCSCLLL